MGRLPWPQTAKGAAMQQPPLIRYNLRDRGREYRGQPRSFDIPRIVESINGPATQERVRTRGMLGYYGHWPRLKFGLDPAEGGMADGRAQHVEPALVTVHLQAYPDGTVEHRSQFLDTPPGQLAARMHANRVGGFSSAIDVAKPELYGFDYVNDPNYSTNRGYDLLCDSVAAGAMTLDDVVAAEQADFVAGVNALIGTLEASLRLATDAAERYAGENAELLEMMTRSTKPGPGHAPFFNVDSAVKEQLERDRRLFRDAPLTLRQPEAKEVELAAEYQRIKQQLGL